MTESDTKRRFLKKFRQNEDRMKPILVLIESYNASLSTLSKLEANLGTIERERNLYQAELASLKASATLVSPEQAGHTKQLEEKIRQLQDDLLSFHKTKENNASEVLRLTEQVQSLKLQLEEKCDTLERANATILAQTREIQGLKEKLTVKNQMLRDLKDEHETLSLTTRGIEDKYTKLVLDHEHAITQIIKLRDEQAKQMDEESANFKRVKQLEAENKRLENLLKSGPSKLLNEFVPIDFTGVEEIGMSLTVPTTKSSSHEMPADVHSVAVHENLYAVGCADSSVHVFKGADRKQAHFRDANGTINTLEFTSDGKYIMAASNDYSCKLWEMGVQRLRATLTGHQGKVLAARFINSEQGLQAITGSSDRTLRLWDLNSSRCLKTYMPGSSCHDIGIISTNLMASGHFDKTVRTYDARSGRETARVKIEGRICSIQTSAESHQYYVTGDCNKVYQLDSRTNEIRDTYSAEGLAISSSMNMRSCLSPDSASIAVCSTDKQIYIFSTINDPGSLQGKLKTDDMPICLAWHESNKLYCGQKGKKLTVYT